MMTPQSPLFGAWAELSRRRAQLEAEELRAIQEALASVSLELVEGAPQPNGRWSLVVQPLSAGVRPDLQPAPLSGADLLPERDLPGEAYADEEEPVDPLADLVIGLPAAEFPEVGAPAAAPEPGAEESATPVLPLPSGWDQFFGDDLMLSGDESRSGSEGGSSPSPTTEEDAPLSLPTPRADWWQGDDLPAWLRRDQEENESKPAGPLPTPEFAPPASSQPAEMEYEEDLLLTLSPVPVLPPLEEKVASPTVELPSLVEPAPTLGMLPELPALEDPQTEPSAADPQAEEGREEREEDPAAAPEASATPPVTEAGFVDVEALADHRSVAGRVAPVGKRRPNPLKSGSSDPRARAVRLAQTLASDMISYRKGEYDTARQQGLEAIRATFQEDIDECRQRFHDQVSETEVPDRDEIFVTAINDILGKNQPVI